MVATAWCVITVCYSFLNCRTLKGEMHEKFVSDYVASHMIRKHNVDLHCDPVRGDEDEQGRTDSKRDESN